MTTPTVSDDCDVLATMPNAPSQIYYKSDKDVEEDYELQVSHTFLLMLLSGMEGMERGSLEGGRRLWTR